MMSGRGGLLLVDLLPVSEPLLLEDLARNIIPALVLTEEIRCCWESFDFGFEAS